MKKRILITISIGLTLIGLVWIGQGIGIIHGSMMTDDSKWAVIGAIMIGVAAILFWIGTKRKAS